jgi:hypothetical protein
MLASVFEYWDGPRLSGVHSWMWILVLAIAGVCLLVLTFLATRRQLRISTHILIAMFPLFLSLALAVGYAWDVYVDYYSYAWIGPPPEHLIVPAMFCTLVGLPSSVALLVTFGIVLLVRSRREQPREKA